MNNAFESVWVSFNNSILDKGNYGLPIKELAEHFFNAGVASTQKKNQQVPALFKPKDTLERNSNE